MRRMSWIWIALVPLCLCLGPCVQRPGIPPELTFALSDAACAPPCWNGITPDETTDDQAVRIIRDLALVDPQSVSLDPASESLREEGIEEVLGWTFGQGTTQLGTGDIWLRDGIVREVRIVLNGAMPVENAFRIHGEPEYVLAMRNPNYTLLVGFIYPNKGLMLLGTRQAASPPEEVQVGKDIVIYRARYYSIAAAQAEIASDDPESPRPVPWNGFGTTAPVFPHR